MDKRYERNCNTLTIEENDRLSELKVCVVGCGGLGGYVIEMLVRLGIGEITAIDGDEFDLTNLNRQLLSLEENLGKSKAKAAQSRASQVNSNVQVHGISKFLDADNSRGFIHGHHVVIDALDNMKSRLILEDACTEEGIPMIHGAIAGWYGQVAVILPGNKLLDKIYPEGVNKGEEIELGNPSFTPVTVASLQVAECIKMLLGREGSLTQKMLTIDLLNQEYDVMAF